MSFRSLKTLTLLFAMCANALGAQLKVGDPAPDLSQFSFEGSLPDIKGKVVLVDFWASWCVPCKKSFPAMNEMLNKFADRGFAVIGISVDENKKDADGFLKKNPAKFATVRDASGKSAEVFGAKTMPSSFLVGPDGKVIAIHYGFEDSTRKLYFTEIDAALKAAGK